jgi:hypothetical protein
MNARNADEYRAELIAMFTDWSSTALARGYTQEDVSEVSVWIDELNSAATVEEMQTIMLAWNEEFDCGSDGR